MILVFSLFSAAARVWNSKKRIIAVLLQGLPIVQCAVYNIDRSSRRMVGKYKAYYTSCDCCCWSLKAKERDFAMCGA